MADVQLTGYVLQLLALANSKGGWRLVTALLQRSFLRSMEGGGAAAAPLDMHSFLYQTGRGAADAGSVQDRSLSRSLSSSAIVEPSAQGQGIASFELYMQQVQQGGGFFPGVKRTHTDPDVLLTRQVPADLSRWQQQEEQQQQQNQQQQQKEKELQQEAHEGEQQQQQPALENQQAFPFQDQEEFLQQLLEGVAAPQHPEEAATAAFMGEYSNHPAPSAASAGVHMLQAHTDPAARVRQAMQFRSR
eukprot:1157936-Pelagomonas_calceolata.AAC.9